MDTVKGVQSVVKPSCRTQDDGGNIYSLIGLVTTCLEREGLDRESTEFLFHAVRLSSYGAVLDLAQDYVDFNSGGSNEPETN